MLLPGWLAGLLGLSLITGFVLVVRHFAKKGDEYYEREFKSPTVLDNWHRPGPGPGA